VRVHGLVTGLVTAGFLAVPIAAAQPFQVAMLPIVVHAAGGDSDYLARGLTEMLSARLELAGGIHVIRLDSDARGTTQPDVAIEAGRAAGADFVVFGSFTQFGDGASLDVRCAHVERDVEQGDAETRQVFVQSGQLGAIIPRLGDLSNRIVHYVKGGLAGAPVSGGEAAADSTAVDDLARRVEALERAVFRSQPAASKQPESGAE
jgi:TolB-like protein